MMCWCILIPILVGLICALLGYLLGRLLCRNKNNDELNTWKSKVITLETELEACKSSKSLSTPKISTTSKIATSSFAATTIAFNAAAAKSVFGKTIKENDLTIVEGIGPAIQKLFQSHGVDSWKHLMETSVNKCQQILDSGGERFKIHNPGTWPDQAKLAYEGKWQELLDWQDQLDGGKVR